MHKYIILTAFILLTGCAGGPVQLDKMTFYTAFQNDADIIRLRHLKYYGNLIEEYHDKTGTYPFMSEANIPLYVFVANKQQINATKDKPPYPTKERSFKDFISLIENELDREINEYYDPQYAGDYKPNFYIYMANKGTYFFAIHQHNSYPFSNSIGKHYNKIEMSNKPTAQNRAVPTSKLLSHKDFEEYLNAPVTKEGFFQDRELKHIHETKN
ncbi:MAG: hypothetical protein ACI93R_001276 [Flavobacteriales bacterium]|jgi:hypothetical protein